MKLRNIVLIARRDYLAYVARRRFWIGLLLTPAILLAVVFVPVLIHKYQSAQNYAVVDQSGWVLKAVRQRIAADDYEKLFGLAAAHQKAGTVDVLPRPLAAIAPDVARLNDSQRHALAKAMAGEAPVARTAAAAQAAWKKRAAFTGWYASLDARRARDIAGGPA